MPVFKLALLFLAGLIAGFVNVMAGGGSLLTIPALIFFGLPPTVANGTNRIALLFQNISSAATFARKKAFYPSISIKLALPAIAGSLLGARIGVDIPDNIFRILLSVIMLVVLFLIVFEPHKKWIQSSVSTMTRTREILLMAAFFGIGIYGGFIQAGVGFIIMTTLSVLAGFPLVKINSIKITVVGLYIAVSLIIYLLNAKVVFIPGLVLAAGNSLGAWIGTSLAIKKGEKLIRIVLSIAVVGMVLKISGLFDFIASKL